MKTSYVKSLFIYPVKSVAGIELKYTQVLPAGLKYDRNWMLVDDEGLFVSQRSHPELVRIGCHSIGNQFCFFSKADPGNKILIDPDAAGKKLVKVQVWKSILNAYELNPQTSEWFSSMLGCKLRLVAFGKDSTRMKYVDKLDIKTPLFFSDGYPVLVLAQASLDLLNSKLSDPLPVNRFRPNIVLNGCPAHHEENMDKFEISGTKFRMVKPCERCQIIATDQETGKRDKEPLKTLSKYRRKGNQVLFGMNAVVLKDGVIRTGDSVVIN